MDVLAKAAVAEISELFSESSAALRLEISRSLKENEILRMRMKVMRSELFALRLQKASASRTGCRFPPKPVSRPRLKRVVVGKTFELQTVRDPSPKVDVPITIADAEDSSVVSKEEFADVETPDVILIKEEQGPDEEAVDCRTDTSQKDFLSYVTETGVGAISTQHQETALGSSSSHILGHNDPLSITSIHNASHQGVGVVVEENSSLFTASELQGMIASLSPDNDTIHHNSQMSLYTRRPTVGVMQDLSGEPQREGLLNESQVISHASGTATNPSTSSLTGKGNCGHIGYQSRPHQDRHPSNAKSLECSFCGKRFYRREDLVRHRASHTGEMPITCSLCGKSFVNKTTLNVHMRIHTGEKPYVCRLCGKSFTQNGSLKIHLRTHSGEKPYSCSHCRASFNNPSNLRRHMVTHSENGGI